MVKHIDLHSINFQRGIHDIEHQITYPGSNFIFHDSQGFEAGASKEMELVWKFIEKRSTAIEVKDQLHVIWYLTYYWFLLWVDDQAFIGIVYPWTALVLFSPQNLSFLIKEQGKASPITINHSLHIMYQA